MRPRQVEGALERGLPLVSPSLLVFAAGCILDALEKVRFTAKLLCRACVHVLRAVDGYSVFGVELPLPG